MESNCFCSFGPAGEPWWAFWGQRLKMFWFFNVFKAFKRTVALKSYIQDLRSHTSSYQLPAEYNTTQRGISHPVVFVVGHYREIFTLSMLYTHRGSHGQSRKQQVCSKLHLLSRLPPEVLYRKITLKNFAIST